MSKWLAKHISTKVSFKITIRKRHVYNDIGWPWIWNQYFYLGIWNDDRTKIIVSPSFQLVTRINSRTEMKLSLLIYYDTLFCIRIMVFPIGIIENSTPRIWSFLHHFSSLHDIWPPSTLNSLVYTSWGEMGRCVKRSFQLLKMRKKKISWNIISKCITDLLLTVRSTRMKKYTCHYDVSTKESNVYINFKKIIRILKFFVYM